MNTVEELLKLDAGKLEKPKKTVKIKLARLKGQEFEFFIEALSPELWSEIQEEAIQFKIEKKSMGIEQYKYKGMLRTIVEGCPTIFKNQELIKHFKAQTPANLVEILLEAGEMDDLKTAIENLSGFNRDNVEEVKN